MYENSVSHLISDSFTHASNWWTVKRLCNENTCVGELAQHRLVLSLHQIGTWNAESSLGLNSVDLVPALR